MRSDRLRGLRLWLADDGVVANLTVLMIGWSGLEGLGAVLIMPAIVALVAANFGKPAAPARVRRTRRGREQYVMFCSAWNHRIAAWRRPARRCSCCLSRSRAAWVMPTYPCSAMSVQLASLIQ